MKSPKYRVVTFLKREELDFIDELAKDIYFTHGINIPRAKLIEEIIEALKIKESKEEIEKELLKRLDDEKIQENKG